MKKLIAAVIVATLVGCNSPSADLSGKYVAKDRSGSELTLRDGKIYTTGIDGKSLEAEFEVEGSKLKYKFPNGLAIVATINKDGSISMPFGTVFYKK